jgi:hypothetical protein
VSLFSLTFYVTQRNAEKFVKNLFGGKQVEAVLQRLDRLTLDEARTTAAEVLKVVYGLVQDMSEQTHISPAGYRITIRLEVRHRMTVFEMPLVRYFDNLELVSCLIERLEILHQIAGDMNKLKRLLFVNVGIADRKH